MKYIMTSRRVIYTIGHSNHSVEKFIELLRQHSISVVVDVRSVPFSRIQTQFDRNNLAANLEKHSITYIFLGKELGGRSDNPTCYENGRVQYQLLAQTKTFQEGLERVRTGSENHRIALMCVEREPLECHRTLLISRELESKGIQVIHIHADGHLELHEKAMERLLHRLSMPERDLFRTHSEIIDEAYSKQEARIAYVDKHLVHEASEKQS